MRTRRAALAAWGLLIAACSGGTSGTMGSQSSTVEGGVATRLEQILDGDSIRLMVDGAEAEIRLLGINAPEASECWGDRAERTLEELLVGAEITIVGSETDQFGRLLATVFADGRDAGTGLLERGAAIALTSGPADYGAVEEAARIAGVGMWAADACGPAATAGVEITLVQFDPAGPDGENLAGEWVELVNSGDRSADLSGWTLRDESSTHRYQLPEGTRIEPGFALVITTGCGEDTPERTHWCAEGPVWNNGGDMAMLLDTHGNVVSVRRYRG